MGAVLADLCSGKSLLTHDEEMGLLAKKSGM
jgi:hypothetical protein